MRSYYEIVDFLANNDLGDVNTLAFVSDLLNVDYDILTEDVQDIILDNKAIQAISLHDAGLENCDYDTVTSAQKLYYDEEGQE